MANIERHAVSVEDLDEQTLTITNTQSANSEGWEDWSELARIDHTITQPINQSGLYTFTCEVHKTSADANTNSPIKVRFAVNGTDDPQIFQAQSFANRPSAEYAGTYDADNEDWIPITIGGVRLYRESLPQGGVLEFVAAQITAYHTDGGGNTDLKIRNSRLTVLFDDYDLPIDDDKWASNHWFNPLYLNSDLEDANTSANSAITSAGVVVDVPGTPTELCSLYPWEGDTFTLLGGKEYFIKVDLDPFLVQGTNGRVVLRLNSNYDFGDDYSHFGGFLSNPIAIGSTGYVFGEVTDGTPNEGAHLIGMLPTTNGTQDVRIWVEIFTNSGTGEVHFPRGDYNMGYFMVVEKYDNGLSVLNVTDSATGEEPEITANGYFTANGVTLYESESPAYATTRGYGDVNRNHWTTDYAGVPDGYANSTNFYYSELLADIPFVDDYVQGDYGWAYKVSALDLDTLATSRYMVFFAGDLYSQSDSAWDNFNAILDYDYAAASNIRVAVNNTYQFDVTKKERVPYYNAGDLDYYPNVNESGFNFSQGFLFYPDTSEYIECSFDGWHTVVANNEGYEIEAFTLLNSFGMMTLPIARDPLFSTEPTAPAYVELANDQSIHYWDVTLSGPSVNANSALSYDYGSLTFTESNTASFYAEHGPTTANQAGLNSGLYVTDFGFADYISANAAIGRIDVSATVSAGDANGSVAFGDTRLLHENVRLGQNIGTWGEVEGNTATEVKTPNYLNTTGYWDVFDESFDRRARQYYWAVKPTTAQVRDATFGVALFPQSDTDSVMIVSDVKMTVYFREPGETITRHVTLTAGANASASVNKTVEKDIVAKATVTASIPKKARKKILGAKAAVAAVGLSKKTKKTYQFLVSGIASRPKKFVSKTIDAVVSATATVTKKTKKTFSDLSIGASLTSFKKKVRKSYTFNVSLQMVYYKKIKKTIQRTVGAVLSLFMD